MPPSPLVKAKSRSHHYPGPTRAGQVRVCSQEKGLVKSRWNVPVQSQAHSSWDGESLYGTHHPVGDSEKLKVWLGFWTEEEYGG